MGICQRCYLSAPSSFIVNAPNEIYSFYMEKAAFGKKYEPIGAAAPPLESATGLHHVITRMFCLVQLHVCSVYDIQVAPKKVDPKKVSHYD